MNRTETDRLVQGLAATLRAERAAHNLTLEQVAEQSGLSRSTVIRLMDGTREVTVSALARLAQVYGVEPADLLREAERRSAGQMAH